MSIVTSNLPLHLVLDQRNQIQSTLLIPNGCGLHYDIRCILVSLAILVVDTQFVFVACYPYFYSFVANKSSRSEATIILDKCMQRCKSPLT